MTARSQARDDAAAVLLAAGWDIERIRQGLGITEKLADRLVRQAQRQPLPTSLLPPGNTCCAEIFMPKQRCMRYCDRPVIRAGDVYCAQHHHGGVWAS